MQKSFSQPLNREPERIYLLLEIATTETFLLLQSKNPHEESFFSVPSLVLDTKKPTSLQLAEAIHKEGFAINSFSKLAERTDISFSFLDDETLGSEKPYSCIHALVDTTNITPASNTERTIFVPLNDFIEKLSHSPIYDQVVIQAAKRILLER